MPVPNARRPKPSQIQFTSGLTVTAYVAFCVCDLVAGEHDVDVFADGAAHRDLGGRLILVLGEEPARRLQLRDLLAVLEHASRAR